MRERKPFLEGVFNQVEEDRVDGYPPVLVGRFGIKMFFVVGAAACRLDTAAQTATVDTYVLISRFIELKVKQYCNHLLLM